jgi:hypothetical protein
MLAPGSLSVALRKLPVGLVDGSQQLAKRGSLLDRPGAIECGPERREIVTGEQSDSHDSILRHDTSTS